MLIKKKGLSAVVATIALIFLSVAAVTIVANFLIPFVRERLGETDCFNYRDYFYFEENYGYNCYNHTEYSNYYYGLSIGARSSKEAANEKVDGFRLAFQKTGEAQVIDVKNGTANNSGEGGIRMLNSSITLMQLPNIGEVKTYIYNSSTGDFNSVDVYAILKDNKVCPDASDSIKVAGMICENLSLNIK